MEQNNYESQLRKSFLSFFVLSHLAKKDMYPGELIQALSDLDLNVIEGSIYTLLNRLQKAGELEYKWVESTQGPPRKYYSITSIGQANLENIAQTWSVYLPLIKNLL